MKGFVNSNIVDRTLWFLSSTLERHAFHGNAGNWQAGKPFGVEKALHVEVDLLRRTVAVEENQ